MNETNHPARRLRHGDRPTEPLTFEDDAANKAAEEGEPTDAELAREVLLEELEGIANYWDCTEVEGVSGNIIDVGKDLREKFAALKFAAIAAGRASRQVANKAEVEPVAWMVGRDLYLHHDAIPGSCLPPLASPVPLYATPPATTGASTVLTDERIEYTNEIGEAGQAYMDTFEFAHPLPATFRWSKLWDVMNDSVAAQAGQVAVPEGWKLVPADPTEAMVHAAEDLPAPRMFGKVYRAMIAAAPSPAKESK